MQLLARGTRQPAFWLGVTTLVPWRFRFLPRPGKLRQIACLACVL
jgi:hypothetical protein